MSAQAVESERWPRKTENENDTLPPPDTDSARALFVPFHPHQRGAFHFMITIPKQDKTTISLNSEGLIAIVQEDDAGETHTVLVNPQMAGRLIEGIQAAVEEVRYEADRKFEARLCVDESAKSPKHNSAKK
jgi:hypothetical protein